MNDKYTDTLKKMQSRTTKLDGLVDTACWWSWNGYGRGQRSEEIERIRGIIAEIDILLNDPEQNK